MADFVVESQGCCFLCLNKIENNMNPGPTPCHHNQSSQVYSLQQLSRYLGLDMGKVFYEGSSTIPNHLISKVRKSKLKVRLCNSCADLNSRFSELQRQLEKIEMEVIFNLGAIHQRLSTAGKTGLCSKLVSVCESVEGLNEKLKIADVIRDETLQKCSLQLNGIQPRVRFVKLTSEEIIAHKEAIRTSRISNKHDPQSIPILETNHIKKEHISDSDSSFGDVEGVDNGELQSTYFSSGEENEEDQTDVKLNTNQRIVPRGKMHRHDHGGDGARTRKSFSHPNSLRRHQIAIHSEQTYNCEKCNKFFSHQSTLRRHQKTIHFGQTYNCDKCSQTFRHQSNLRRHRITIHFGQRFSCRFCNQSFSQAGHRNIHMKKKCPKRKKIPE